MQGWFVRSGIVSFSSERWLLFEVSYLPPEDDTEDCLYPIEAQAPSSAKAFKQNEALTQRRCIVFEDHDGVPINLYLTNDVAVDRLGFPDVIGKHIGDDAYNFRCFYRSDNRHVSDDILRQQYLRFELKLSLWKRREILSITGTSSTLDIRSG